MHNRKHCHRRTKIGAVIYKTSTAAIRQYLSRTRLSQAEIARRCRVSPACVCQLAADIR
jgi:hypothetical protein